MSTEVSERFFFSDYMKHLALNLSMSLFLVLSWRVIKSKWTNKLYFQHLIWIKSSVLVLISRQFANVLALKCLFLLLSQYPGHHWPQAISDILWFSLITLQLWQAGYHTAASASLSLTLRCQSGRHTVLDRWPRSDPVKSVTRRIAHPPTFFLQYLMNQYPLWVRISHFLKLLSK